MRSIHGGTHWDSRSFDQNCRFMICVMTMHPYVGGCGPIIPSYAPRWGDWSGRI